MLPLLLTAAGLWAGQASHAKPSDGPVLASLLLGCDQCQYPKKWDITIATGWGVRGIVIATADWRGETSNVAKRLATR